MIVVTAPKKLNEVLGDRECLLNKNFIFCFLAGGITGCSNWQKNVICHLELDDEELKDLVLFNPRRDDFPIHDPNAADQQIEWEFDYLNMSNIFSIYFDGGNSDQPICMYELGRYLTMLVGNYGRRYLPVVPIISVNPGYKRQKDVFKQVELATGKKDLVKYAKPEEHAYRIMEAYKALNNLRKISV